MLILPIRHDAPVYHRPFGTGAVMAICTALSVAAWYGAVDGSVLRLEYEEFRPHQWVTSIFLHAGIFHLLGNMIFLWTFGRIVEGKIGAPRFLAVFLGIGVAQNVVEHILFSTGASLGASGVIFGLMGMSLVWAPLNEITWSWYFLYRVHSFQSTVRGAAIFFACWELFWTGFGMLMVGFHLSSGLLHLLGFAVGFPLGVWMLRNDLVDCEGWDWFSVRRGDHLRKSPVLRRRTPVARTSRSLFDQPDAASAALEVERLRERIAAGDAAGARTAHQGLGQPLDDEDLRALAMLYHDAGMWNDAARAMREHRKRFADSPARVGLRLAEIAIRHQRRPTAGLQALSTVARTRLTADEQRLHDDLLLEAEILAAESPLELEDDDEF